MRSMILWLILALLITAPVAAQDNRPAIGPPLSMVGNWRACLVLTATGARGVPVPNATCGDVRVSSDTFTDVGFPPIVALKAQHTMNLGSLFRSSRWPDAASVRFVIRDSATADSSAFQLRLGGIGGFDNGSVIALVRQDSTGALSGTWHISCYVCDDATGTIVLRRKP